MLRTGNLKIVGRLMSIAFLLATMMGPWFADSHPATAETCRPPLVWLGNGYCACLITFVAFAQDLLAGHSSLWLLGLLPVLPVLSTLLLLLIGERRWLWVCHLTVWGLAVVHALFWFVVGYVGHRGILILWGAGLGGLVSIAILLWEILMHRRARGFDGGSKVGFPMAA